MRSFTLSSADELEHQRHDSSVDRFLDILGFCRSAGDTKQPGELDHGLLPDDLEEKYCRDARSIEDLIAAA